MVLDGGVGIDFAPRGTCDNIWRYLGYHNSRGVLERSRGSREVTAHRGICRAGPHHEIHLVLAVPKLEDPALNSPYLTA